jgi:hypothetical protein
MDEDELQDGQADGQDGDKGTDSGSDNSAPPTNEPAGKDDSKRVDDLMSMFNREQARANRAEAALAAATGGQGTKDDDTNGDDGLEEFKAFARETARNTLFDSDPRLAAAGLTADDIAGSTLSEMKESVSKHQKVVSGIEGRLRNQILAEHGLSPEVQTGAGTEEGPSFSKMSKKEFADFLAERDGTPH